MDHHLSSIYYYFCRFIALVALSVTACSPAPASVEIIQREWEIDTQSQVANAGPVTFVVTNLGNLEHNFVIEGMEETIELILPQDTQSLLVRLDPGTYSLICNLSGHQEAGMETTFTVDP